MKHRQKIFFSRVLFNEEILVVYNSSVCDAKVEYIEIDYRINKISKHMKALYGYENCVEVLYPNNKENKIRFIIWTQHFHTIFIAI